MKKNIKSLGLCWVLSIVFSVLSIPGIANATTGGPTFIYNFKYNPQDESVYYISISHSGRGCPPELMKMSLSTGVHQTVFSCDQGEKMLSNGNYDVSLVYAEINKLTTNFKNLSPINLKKNNIAVDINFQKSEKLSQEENAIKSSMFEADIYQDNKKIIDMSLQGCNLEQPFMFEGYAIPGFDKKIVLLLSTKGDCIEGGYTRESLHVLGGLSYINKEYINSSKGETALTLHEGTLVVYENETLKNDLNIPVEQNLDVETVKTNTTSKLILPISIILALLIGILIGRMSKKSVQPNETTISN